MVADAGWEAGLSPIARGELTEPISPTVILTQLPYAGKAFKSLPDRLHVDQGTPADVVDDVAVGFVLGWQGIS